MVLKPTDRGGVFDTKGAEAFKHGRNVVGHREGDGAASPIVGYSAAKESGGYGGSFNMIGFVQTGNEAVEGSRVTILDPEVINDESEVNRVGMVGKETRLYLEIAVGFQALHELLVSVKAGLAKSRHSLFYSAVKERFAARTSLDKRGSTNTVKSGGGEKFNGHNNIFEDWHGGTQVEISDISGTKGSILRHSGM